MKQRFVFQTVFLLLGFQLLMAQEPEKKVRSIVFASGVTLRADECRVPNKDSGLKFCMPKDGATKTDTGNGYQLRDLSCQEKGKDFRPCAIQEFDPEPGGAPSCHLLLLGFSITLSRFDCPKQAQ